MELKVIRAKKGISVPSNPEDKSSLVKFVQQGIITIVPSSYKMPEDSFDLISKVNTVKEQKPKK